MDRELIETQSNIIKAQETVIAQQKQCYKGLLVALIAAIVLTLITNVGWMLLWNLYDHTVTTETIEYTIEQDSQGINTITGSFNGLGGYDVEQSESEKEQNKSQSHEKTKEK